VVVAGAGVAGLFAAIAAAREGATTVLVDRFSCPGGNIGPGMIAGGSLSGGNGRHLCGGFIGIPREFIERHVALGGGSVPDSPNLGELPPSPHPTTT
jgi:glycine/D-amino acid oxidase-like deaminating enzyme